MNKYENIIAAAIANQTAPVLEKLESIRADQVKIEAIDWLWPYRFALGNFGILGGNPERGKGLIVCDIFSRITRGAPWPCGEGKAEIGDVILLQQEDNLHNTVVPRLIAAGADLSRVHILTMVAKTDGSGRRVFNAVTDLPMLRAKLEEANDPQLLVIDPLSAYIGKLNAGSSIDVRGALMPLVDLLQEFRIAGLAVHHFNKKVEVESPLARLSDSVAFGALARHCFVVTDDRENERRLFVKAKNNLAPDIKALSFTIKEVNAGQDTRDGRDIKAPCIVWGHEHVEISALQAMRAEAGGTAATNPRKEAKDFLIKILANAPVLQKEIEEHAEAELISVKTLRRAKSELGILSKKDGVSGQWSWSLPGKGDSDEF